MRITVLTPLFPPDTGAPAPYAKELAQHLHKHTVTVIAYGRLPESVENTSIIAIDKRGLKIGLIMKCLRTLFSTPTDLLLVNNGPSSELPALMYSFFSKTPIVLIESDIRAASTKSRLHSLIHSQLAKRCQKVVALPEESNYLKPEVLPFNPVPQSTFSEVTDWWKKHIQSLISYDGS